MKRVLAGIALLAIAALALLYWLDPGASEGASGPTGEPVSERDAQRTELEAEADSATETAPHEEVREVAAEAEPALAYLLVHAKESASYRGIPDVVLLVERLDYAAALPLPVVMGGGDPITDAVGIRQFIVPAGVRLRVSGSGPIQSASMEVDSIAEGEHGIANLMVRPDGVPFHGLVLATETGFPVADARIRGGRPGATIAMREAWFPPERRDDAVSNTAGRFLLSASPVSTVVLQVEADGFSPALVSAADARGTQEEPYEIRMRVGGKLDVLLREKDAPASNVTIELMSRSEELGTTGTDSMYGREFLWEGVTDENGRAEFANLPSEVRLSIRLLREAEVLRALTEPLILTAGEHREVTWEIGSGSHIVGHAIDQKGSPLASYPIFLRSARGVESENIYVVYEQGTLDTSVTDDAGTFEFSDIAAGPYFVGPKSRSTEFDREFSLAGAAPYAQRIEVVPGEDLEFTLAVYRELTIQGTVLCSDGEPADGELVFATAMGNGAGAVRTRTRSGEFIIGPLAPGRFRLTTLPMNSGHGGSEPVEARAGDEGIVIQLVLAASVHVDIVDENGDRVECSIAIYGEGQNGLSRGISGAGSRGYDLDSLMPGSYTIVARTPDGRIGMLRETELGPGPRPENLTVRVSPGGRLRLRNAGEQALPVKLLSNGFEVASSSLAPGTSGAQVVPAGFVTIRIETPEGPMEVAVRVEAGAEEIVVLPIGR